MREREKKKTGNFLFPRRKKRMCVKVSGVRKRDAASNYTTLARRYSSGNDDKQYENDKSDLQQMI